MEQSQVRKYFVMCSMDAESTARKLEIRVDFSQFTLEHALKSYMGSTSPRVHAQSKARAYAKKNHGRFPDFVEMSAAEYANGQTGAMVVREPTNEEILAANTLKAQNDPEWRKQRIAELMAMENAQQ